MQGLSEEAVALRMKDAKAELADIHQIPTGEIAKHSGRGKRARFAPKVYGPGAPGRPVADARAQKWRAVADRLAEVLAAARGFGDEGGGP